MSIQSENDVFNPVSAEGSAIIVSIGGRDRRINAIIVDFLPCINLMAYITVLKALFCGNCTSKNGTAAKLNLSEIHIPMETMVITIA